MLADGEVVGSNPSNSAALDMRDPEGSWSGAVAAVHNALSLCPSAVLPSLLRAVEDPAEGSPASGVQCLPG